MKGKIVRLILETVNEDPANLYDALEQKGYPRTRSWIQIPKLKKMGYLAQIGKGRYVLTAKGKKRLNRLVFGLAKCPFCGSTHVRRNGKRNGVGRQRFLCVSCKFTWTQGLKLEALIRALKKKKRVVFILHTSERFSLQALNKLKEWLADFAEPDDYLKKHIALLVP